MQIETVTEASFERVLPLIAAYQRFYQTEPNEARNRAHFGQFLHDHRAGVQFLASDEAEALGFATLYFPFSSVSAAAYCVMNDLFVVPEARGRGVGRTLIAHCADYARAHGFLRLVWETEPTNATAQHLYDRTGATRTERVIYTLATS